MTTWLRRTLPIGIPDHPTGALQQIAASCVSAHHGALYTLYQLRWDSGREALAAFLSGSGRGIGPWEDTMLDLETGREFTVSSEDADVEARRLTIADVPAALLAAWPTDDRGRAIPPGLRDSGPVVDASALRRIARIGLTLRPQASLFDKPGEPARRKGAAAS